MKRCCFLLSVFVVNGCLSQGIRDSTVHLKEALIREVKTVTIEDIHVPKSALELESENKGVTEYLKKSQSFFIKNYGQGGLASIAYRGTSAAQNEVYWNGVKINSPFTGQIDGNLLMTDPRLFLSHSSVSNAIGARIRMNDEKTEKGIVGNFLIRYNTLNSVDLNGNVNYANDNFYVLTNVSTMYAKNNYRIPNVFVKDGWKKQVHNALSMTNVKATLGYKFKDKHNLSASFWWSRNNREIAPLLTQQTSQQTQYDKSIRALLNYSGFVKKISFALRTSALTDELSYRDEAISLSSHSRSFVSRNEASVEYAASKQKMAAELAVKYDYEQAKASGFISSKHRSIAEFRQQINYEPKNVFLQATAFQTIYQNKVFPTFNVWLNYRLKTKFIRHHFAFFAAKTLRIPLMNDLYWAGSGNPNLRPEKGWKGDVKSEMNHDYFQTKFTVYGQYTTDWILWTPTGNPNLWMPQNLKRVYGCGTEVFASAGWFEKTSRKWFAYFVSSYSWNRAINMDKISANDASENKQLIYVPIHKTYTALRSGWRGFSASLDYTYFSKIYTSTDNSQSLKGYGLMDFHVSKDFFVKRQKIAIGFGIYNLLDTQYQTMPQRAMPGRYYEMLVRFSLYG